MGSFSRFGRITSQKPDVPKIEPFTVVYNLSDHSLERTTTDVLVKGFNFAIAATRIPVESISNVESTIRRIEGNETSGLKPEL